MEFMKLTKNDPIFDNQHRQEAILKLNLVAKSSNDDKFIGILIFRQLDELHNHDLYNVLLMLIKNAVSDKAGEDLMNELENKEEIKEKKINLKGMDVGLLSGKKSQRYEYMYKEDIEKVKTNKKKKRRKKQTNIEQKKILSDEDTNEICENNLDYDKSKCDDIKNLKEGDELNQSISKNAKPEELNVIKENKNEQLKEDTENKEILLKESKNNWIRKFAGCIILDIINGLPYQKSKKRKKNKKHQKDKQHNFIEKDHIKEDTDSKASTSDEQLDVTLIEREHYLDAFFEMPFYKAYENVTKYIVKRYKDILDYNKTQEIIWSILKNNIEMDVRKCFNDQNITVEIYGSASSGLAIISSDLDLGIMNLSLNTRDDAITAIKKLSDFLSMQSYITSVDSILTARIPVLKAISELTEDNTKSKRSCKIDITFNINNENQVIWALNASKLSIKLINKYKYLKEATIFFKEKLSEDNLNIPFKGINKLIIGGINSYGLLLLIVAYYSMCPTFSSAGEFVIRILDFYVNYFNNILYGIYYNGITVEYYPLPMPLYYKCLVILDPFNSSNNITASLHKFDDIRECFKKLLNSMISN